MRPGHVRSVLTNPATAIRLLPDALEVFCGPPMHSAGYGVPHLVEAGFLGWRWGDLQRAVVS